MRTVTVSGKRCFSDISDPKKDAYKPAASFVIVYKESSSECLEVSD